MMNNYEMEIRNGASLEDLLQLAGCGKEEIFFHFNGEMEETEETEDSEEA